MEFEGQYLTKQEYLDLGGSTIDNMPFNLLEFEVRKRIDLKTFNRLVGQNDIPQEVKICEYDLIELTRKNAEMMNRSSYVSSVNTDGYSESYITPVQIKEAIKNSKDEINDVIKNYLGKYKYRDEYLMYCGVYNANKFKINNLS